MHRKLGKDRPLYLSATCRKDADKELIRHFKTICTAEGLSVQQGLLLAIRRYLQD